VVLAALDEVEMYATDIDPAAVRCARGNLDPERSHVFHGSLEAPLPARLRGRVDVLVANVPYVPTAELGLLPAEARLHEPTIALDGGFDGLEVLRRVAGIAPAWLSPGGVALMEASERQVEAALSALEAAGLDARVSASDDLEAAVVVGRLRCT
jgi:release factor glutamine methyltransferase